MGNERKKINLTDIDENSIVASFKEERPADRQVQVAGNKRHIIRCIMYGGSIFLCFRRHYISYGRSDKIMLQLEKFEYFCNCLRFTRIK